MSGFEEMGKDIPEYLRAQKKPETGVDYIVSIFNKEQESKLEKNKFSDTLEVKVFSRYSREELFKNIGLPDYFEIYSKAKIGELSEKINKNNTEDFKKIFDLQSNK